MSNYMAISENAVVENTRVGCDLYLKSKVNGVYRYILFCRKDELFCGDRKKELLVKNIKKLFISESDFGSYFKYQEKILQSILDDKNKSSEEKSNTVYHVAKNLAQDLLEDPRSGVNIGRAVNWVNKTISYILNDEHAFSSLIKVTSHDYYTYTHSVNLSVLGLLFGKHLSLNHYDLNCLGIGMLLHDLGKVDIPLEILNKPGKLTKEEYDIVKGHPESGIKLLENKESIEEKSLKVIIQHHEDYDGNGYPSKIGGNDIHLFGRITRIIDVYDAMTTNRVYAGAKRPFTALMEMKEKMSNCF